MKKLLTLAVALVISGASVLAQDSPKSKNAFEDVKQIGDLLKKIRQHNDTNARRSLTGIILTYYKGQNIEMLADLRVKFSSEINDIVTQVLSDRNYTIIGAYISGSFSSDNYATYHTSKTQFDQKYKDYILNIPKLASKVKDLQAMLPQGQKIVDQNNKLAQMSKLQDLVTLLSAKINPATNAADTILKYKPQIDLALASAGLKDQAMLTDTVGKLNAYQADYKIYVTLTGQIGATEKIIDDIIKQTPNIVANAIKGDSRRNPVIVNDGYIATSVGVVAQQTLLPDAEKNISAGENSLTTKLVDALAILLVQHAKQDLLLAFFQKLRTEAAKQPLVLDMFPHTYALLSEYPIYELPKFGALWSHAIAEDLADLPRDVAFGKYVRGRAEIVRSDEYKAFTDMIQIADIIRKHSTFSGLVNYFNTNPDSLKNDYIKTSFRTLRMIYQECVKEEANGRYTLALPADLDNLSVEDGQVMIGLLSVKYPLVFNKFQKQFTLSDQAQAVNLRRYLSNILTIFYAFNQQLNTASVKDDKDNVTQISKITLFWDTLGDLFKTINNGTLLKPDPAVDRFLTFSGNCLDIYRDIEEKNYAAMVHEGLQLIMELTPQRYSSASLLIKTWKLDKDQAAGTFSIVAEQFNQLDLIISSTHQPDDTVNINRLIDLIYKANGIDDILNCSNKATFRRQIFTLYENSKTLPSSKKIANNVFINSLSRIGQFWADVLSAKKSSDLSAVIESYAVQPSSYLIKRNTRASVSFNAFLGTYFGGEWAPALKPVFGLSAPIGLSFNWGFHRKTQQITENTFLGHDGLLKTLTGSSFSINLSVIDIGAVASYRINNGNDGPLPQNFNIGQLLAPGLSLSYGIKGIPLCFNIGVELTPELRSLSTTTQPQPAIRLYGGLFYDLPFHTFSKR